MKTGRDREVAEIVTHDRAVEVAKLLMGKLNGPMRLILPEIYHSKTRRELQSGVASLGDGRAEQLASWCDQNFGTRNFRRLARLYQRLYDNSSQLRLPLKEFAELIGQPQEGVLRGAPRHSTIAISPWGLQTEFPEMHLVRDLAFAFNSAIRLDAEIGQLRGTTWSKAKENETKQQIANLNTQAAFFRRVSVLSCFNLIEAYLNGIAWGFIETHDASRLSRGEQELLTGGQDGTFLKKVVRIPEIVTGKNPGPLDKNKAPLLTFGETIKPFRDSIVHASPFSAQAKFGGYDKLSKVYDLTLQTAENTVALTVDIIGRIHRFVGGSGQFPNWLPPRGTGGTFDVEKVF